MRRRAFTLIELVAVLLIMGIALGIASPSLRGFTDNGKLRDAAQSIAAATTWAQSRAVADAKTYQVVIDTAANSYVVQSVEGTQASAVTGEFGTAMAPPQGFRVEVKMDGGSGNAIQFLPDGSTTPATITITSVSGATAQVACLGPAESFAVVKQQ